MHRNTEKNPTNKNWQQLATIYDISFIYKIKKKLFFKLSFHIKLCIKIILNHNLKIKQLHFDFSGQ